MGARGRANVERSASSESKLTYTEFLRRFPDTDACLDWLRQKRWPDGIICTGPRCGKVRNHHKVNGRQAYACDVCRHQVYPTRGTIFQKSSTNLQLWFYAIFLMSSTRCGISAKQLERELGVTYPTAWRMFREIRSLLGEPDLRLAGKVEVDETYLRRRRRASDGPGRAGKSPQERVVVGLVERGGRIVAIHVADATAATLVGAVVKHVMPASMVFTDEHPSYQRLGQRGYVHQRIKHSAEVYVMGDVHTQTIEGFWSLFKRGVNGVYHSVSAKHLQKYLDEYTFRYSYRDDPRAMFDSMLDRLVSRTSSAPSPG